MSSEFKPMLKPMGPDSGAGTPCGACASEPRVLSEVPGFWGRCGALIVDLFVLSLLARAIGSVGFEVLYPLRHITQFFGLLLVFIYFWIGSSSLTHGQTLGKWVFGYRVVSRAGGFASFDKAGIRAIGVFAAIFCYLLVWPLVSTIFGLPGRALLIHMTSVESFLFTEVGRAVTSAFVLSSMIYCGLHPKKLSLHDLLAGTAVIRVQEEERARAFLSQEEDEPAYAKRRLAPYPAIMVAVVTLFFLVSGSMQNLKPFREYLPPVLEAREQLQVDGFILTGLLPPSKELSDRFDGSLKRFRAEIAKAEESGDNARAQQMRASLTSDTLKLMLNGKKYHFLFECDDIWTSETLLADEEFRNLRASLPAVVDHLRAQAVTPEDGKTVACEGIQVEFTTSLPLGLHTELHSVWNDVIPWTEPTTETLVAP